MSSSVPVTAVANAKVEFSHSSKADLKLWVTHDDFPREGLQLLLDSLVSAIAYDLHVISHYCKKSERPNVRHTPREFSLACSGIQFGLEVSVVIGDRDVPVDVVCLVAQRYVSAGIYERLARDIEKEFDIPVSVEKVLQGAQVLRMQSVSDVLGELVQTMADMDATGTVDGDGPMLN